MLIPSRYNHEVLYNGKRYLYNLLSVALVELQGKEDFLSFVEKQPELKGQFEQMGFLVESEVDEFDKYRYYHDCKRYGDAARKFKLELIPTYGCNLRCPYCYQRAAKRSLKMGVEGAERVLRFADGELSRMAGANAVDIVNIGLFGGEPMMDKDGIVRFCAGMREIGERVKLPITFDMTTNLTLLDETMVSMIRDFDVMTQVTIDGPRAFHDKRRVTTTGSGTYDLILANLKRLCNVGLSRLAG